MKYDLGFGNSFCVREAFLNTYKCNLITFSNTDLVKFDYPAYDGDPELVEYTKKVVERQTGQTYRHLFLTNGATGAIHITLMAYRQMGMENCLTRNAPYYLRYPDIIKSAGLNQIGNRFWQDFTVSLMDIPSNPQGLLCDETEPGTPLIIDGVYLNKVYGPKFVSLPEHQVMIGSYSKLIGLNGLRLGWIATNDDLLAIRLKQLVLAQYCGLCASSTILLKSILEDFSWSTFESLAKHKLDSNREEWSKLSRFFSGYQIPENGMFHFTQLDVKAKETFEKAGINWTTGSSLGTDDQFCRFNLGHYQETIKNAVKDVLKLDSVK